MNILKMHGLPPSGLQQVFNAKVLSKLTYASPAWCGLTGRDDVGRIDSFLRRAKKFGYYSQDGKMFDELCLKADDELFKKVRTNTNHVLHSRFLPEQKQVHYDSHVMTVIYLAKFAKSDFMTDIACPHIWQHFLTCCQNIFLLFFTCTGWSKKYIKSMFLIYLVFHQSH